MYQHDVVAKAEFICYGLLLGFSPLTDDANSLRSALAMSGVLCSLYERKWNESMAKGINDMLVAGDADPAGTCGILMLKQIGVNVCF
ncbi:hypothetical protein Nepgr_010437 [Nepenthes gracilis]|uniref:Uncharacterized protein n=1 Tax=Nepenthes gracilis TaxID=150966 RepID=A0AAD3SDD9_NEPGR|nr:hypothetical protein Nepgr_010437 [Nepenthes gracilis]